MRVFVTGGSGFLGWNLCRHLVAASHEVVTTSFEHPVPEEVVEGAVSVDLAQPESLVRAFGAAAPEVVVHAAALTSTGICEERPALAKALNVEATAALAAAVASAGVRLIHLSTDLVFDGARGGYGEEDEPRPLMVYGESKLEAERRVRASGADALIVRVTPMYGRGPAAHRSFVGWLGDGLARPEGVRLFVDEFRAPVYVDDVCAALETLLLRPEVSGIVHLGGERIDRASFGRLYAEVFGLDAERVLGVPRSELPPGTAPRPADVSLDCSLAGRLIGYRPRSAREGLVALREALDRA